MAFDHPIEADRTGDFNFFSAFVRFPLLILEGVLGKKGSDDEKDILDSKEYCEQSTASGYPDSNSNSPSRIVSNDDLSSQQNANNDVLQNRINNHALGRSRSSRPSSLTDLANPPGLKRTRRMSWSDESGLSLVEYSDKSVRHEPVSPYHNATSTTAPKPAIKKSSMTRSRSIRTNAVEADRTRYIPDMNKGEKGLVMPLRPNGNKDSPVGGEYSPQWGWYTTLTPPDVTYGANNNKTRRQAIEASSMLSMSAGLPTAPIIPEAPENCANEVFQSLQNTKTPVGWTSVPI